jgi:hypothetical protein
MVCFADDFWTRLIDHGLIIPVVAIAFGCTIAIVGIVFGSVKAMVVAKERENTKRELAAYVAEGSMEPEKAVAILEAGRDGDSSCC